MPIIRRQDMNRREGMSPGLEVCQIADAEQGTQSLRIGEVTLAPNTRVPRHAHANTEEVIVVVALPFLEEDGPEETWGPEYFLAPPLSTGSYSQPPAVPEPGTGMLLGAGLIALGMKRRRTRS